MLLTEDKDKEMPMGGIEGIDQKTTTKMKQNRREQK